MLTHLSEIKICVVSPKVHLSWSRGGEGHGTGPVKVDVIQGGEGIIIKGGSAAASLDKT